jgi:type I restriction enzyme R subunit
VDPQPLNRAGMWPAQIRAVQNLEASLGEGRRRALLLVDRGNLGRQALKEFQAYSTPDDGRKFQELYNVVITTIQRLDSILKGEAEFAEDLEEESACDGHGPTLERGPPPVVHNERISPDFFDVIVVDEF